MPKINVRGINKNAILNNIFTQLNATTPGLNLPSEGAIRLIATSRWGLDLSDANEEFDDTLFVNMHHTPGLMQSVVDQLRSQHALQAMPGLQSLQTQQLAQQPQPIQVDREKRNQQDFGGEPDGKRQKLDQSAPFILTSPVPGPAAASAPVSASVLTVSTDESNKWEAKRQAEEAQRQAADIENARRAREAIAQSALETARLEAERKAIEDQRTALEAKRKALELEQKALEEARVSVLAMSLGSDDDHTHRNIHGNMLGIPSNAPGAYHPSREVKYASESRHIASAESFDQYRNELLRNWLIEGGLEKEVEGIYLTKQSKLVNILGRTPQVAQAIYDKLVKDLQNILNRKGVNAEELSTVVYPPKILEFLYGFRIPFEKNAFSGENDTTPVFPNGRIEGKGIEVKIPYLRIADTKKLVYYIIQRLEKGITGATLQEGIPSLDELLPTLPPVPTDEATQRLIKSYEGLVRFQESIQAPGYGRVLFDDFEVFAQQIATKIPSPDLSKLIVDGYLRQTRNGVAINESELCELLAKLYGEKPRIRAAAPQTIMPAIYSVPVEINAPKLPNAKSHTTLLIDVSGSMDGYEGRLHYLKKALIETVTLLAQKPGQTLTIITFESNIHQILKGQALNKDTLPGIIAKIDALQAGGGTNAQPALEQAFNAIEGGVNQKIILGTDGEFTLQKERLTEILKRKGVMAPSIGVFAIDYSETGPNVKNLEDISGLGTEGSQLIFTKRDEMDKTVKRLILDKANRAVDTLTVTITVDGAKPQSMVLTPCLANKVIQRFVDVPAALAEQAIRQNTPLTLTFNCIYDDKSTVSSHITVTPTDLMLAQKNRPSVRAQREYINEWYNHALYKRGVVQTNQLNLYSLEEQLKLLSDVQAAARAENLQHDFVPDALMFVLAKWCKMKQAELTAHSYQYSNNPQAKFEKLQANVAEAEKYGFYSLAIAFKNEMQVLEEKLWLDRRVADIAKIAFDLTISSEAALDSHHEVDAGMRDDIYRRILLEASSQGKPQETIDRLKAKISEQWLTAALIERADADYQDSFENLGIEQQLGIVNRLRVVAEKDPLATEQQRKVLAQMWINRILAVNVAAITGDNNLLAKPALPVVGPGAPSAAPAAPAAPVVEPQHHVRHHHRFRRRRPHFAAAVPAAAPAPVAPIVPVMKSQEAVTRIAQAMLKLSFEQHQEILNRLKTAASQANDGRARDLINGMAAEQDAAKAKGVSWSPSTDEIVFSVPKRTEQTFNEVDAGGTQNAVTTRRYRRRMHGGTSGHGHSSHHHHTPAPTLMSQPMAQSAGSSRGERNLLGLVVMVSPATPAPMLLSGGPGAGAGAALGMGAGAPGLGLSSGPGDSNGFGGLGSLAADALRFAREQAKAFSGIF